jgi:NitT/TauT family transport system substrate-binding protein
MKCLPAKALILYCMMLTAAVPAVAADTVRVGVLKFGTVNWTLSVMEEQGLAERHGVTLEVVPLANKDGISVALQGGAVDLIVTDWIWVSRQRAEDRLYAFSPYSLTVGAVMVRPDAGIDEIADLLDGKRLGVAGGPVDKSWLLLRAYTQRTLDRDIGRLVRPNFAAPPLLNALILQGDLDAVLNFWHYNARLQAAGMTRLIEVEQILPTLGVDAEVPLLGWVFDESWAEQHRDRLTRFLDAARDAQQLMMESDELWTGMLRPLTQAEDVATLLALRDSYRAGVPRRFGTSEINASARVFAILAELGGRQLVGSSKELTPGTFWTGYMY